jgi:cytoskeletal protein CcmA (bactofilin family)
VKGTLVSTGTLILGEHSSMEGTIEGNAVTIGGRFDGIINARGRVEIQTGAIVIGEVHTPCLIIEPGAVFDGRCHMLAAPQAKSEAPKTITIPIRSAAAQA